MGVLIAGVWMFALLSGGVLTLGLIALATGRVPFQPSVSDLGRR